MILPCELIDDSFVIEENNHTENSFTFQTFRHGFPHNPTALAFDPVQRLLAIGDKYGSLRM
jgi:syntaxin-binding protein 5